MTIKHQRLTDDQCQLIEEHFHLVSQVASKFCNSTTNYDDLADIAQEALIHSATRYQRDKGNFGGYAWRVMTNAVKKNLINKSKKGEKILKMEDIVRKKETEVEKDEIKEDFFINLEKKEEIFILNQILEEESDKMVEIFLLKERFLSKSEKKLMSQKEFAKRYNLTQPQISKMEKRAKEHLKRELEKRIG